MKYCSYCRNEMPDRAVFCDNCGKKFPPSTIPGRNYESVENNEVNSGKQSGSPPPDNKELFRTNPGMSQKQQTMRYIPLIIVGIFFLTGFIPVMLPLCLFSCII